MAIPVSKRAILCGLAMLGAAAAIPAAAGDDMLSKAINDPMASWGIYGAAAKTEFVTDSTVQGGQAKRVTISPKPDQPWDAGTYAMIVKPVQKGDVLLLAYWARAEKTPQGGDTIELSGRITEAAPSNVGITPETAFHIGKQWKLYYASGTAGKDYPVGALSCGLLLGTGEQIVDFGPVFIVDYGPGYDLAKLPHN